MKPERDGRIAAPESRLIITRRDVLAAAALGLAAGPVRPAWAAADGQLTWAIHVSLAPVWFEPAEASGIITPFMVLYALHDAMVKPDAWQGLGAEPRRVLDRRGRWPQL